jgi:hypothetical protein
VSARLHGLTGAEWMRELFEYENCEECGKDQRNHVAVPFLGNWFAACKPRKARQS